MKKYILILGVMVIFAGYVIYSRRDGDSVNLAPPAGLTTPTAATGSSGGSGSSSAVASGSGTPPTPQTTPAASATTANPSAAGPAAGQGQYKDGSYTSPVENAYFGSLQIQVAVSGGKISDVAFLQFPNANQHSKEVSQQALPYLKSEAIQAQSANVNIVSGATQTSQAFQQALASALNQAQN
jgi:uncharacterized protein with FMN-binding domain